MIFVPTQVTVITELPINNVLQFTFFKKTLKVSYKDTVIYKANHDNRTLSSAITVVQRHMIRTYANRAYLMLASEQSRTELLKQILQEEENVSSSPSSFASSIRTIQVVGHIVIDSITVPVRGSTSVLNYITLHYHDVKDAKAATIVVILEKLGVMSPDRITLPLNSDYFYPIEAVAVIGKATMTFMSVRRKLRKLSLKQLLVLL